MTDSILTTTKAALGLADDYTAFDAELVMHINSVFGTLNQLGLGPENGFSISDKTADWADFLPPDPDDNTKTDARYNPVKDYIFLRLRLIWDPPTIGYVLTAWKEERQELEWRLQVLADPAYVPPETIPLYDYMGDPIN